MNDETASIWQLRPNYFKNGAGTYHLNFKGRQIVLEPDNNGHFSWKPDNEIPIGIFAKYVG